MSRIMQQAFTGENRMLKGGLHTHTTRSDGRTDPEGVVRLHHAHGYDFLALTDHRYYNFRQFAPETGVLVIPAMEMDAGISNPRNLCFHTVAIGPEKADGNGFEQDQRFESRTVADQFEYQSTVDMLREAGNLVLYCHPEWSCTPAKDFEQLKGCFGMEIWNTGCVDVCDQDRDAAWWDEVLTDGYRFWGVATDDGHWPTDYCRGWVMVNAKKNTHDILRALEEGAFYSSCGPVIRSFYVEDGKAHVECEGASCIRFACGNRPSLAIRGEGLTSGEFRLSEQMPYVRAVVTDAQGLRAWTNPIFLK